MTSWVYVLLEHYEVALYVCCVYYRQGVLPLVQYAIAHPVLQLEDNNEQVMADRQQTLDNIIHQADQVLRKCVSKKITTFKGQPLP